jgi:hypothetical protein
MAELMERARIARQSFHRANKQFARLEIDPVRQRETRHSRCHLKVKLNATQQRGEHRQ